MCDHNCNHNNGTAIVPWITILALWVLGLLVILALTGCQYPTRPISKEAADAIAKSEAETREAARSITFDPIRP
jgi:hypothetical protein